MRVGWRLCFNASPIRPATIQGGQGVLWAHLGRSQVDQLERLLLLLAENSAHKTETTLSRPCIVIAV